MSDTILCDAHGEASQTFVCVHLKGETCGLGFNREDPSDEDPHPDAWCDACEVLRAEHGGWDNVPDELCELALLCSECYERARIRHTRPTITFDDLSPLRWKCGSCASWHTGPCLDFGFSEPFYWSSDCDQSSRWTNLIPRALKKPSPTFLDLDYCSIHGESFFIRGIINLPIIGAGEFFRWGVWGSLSRENFDKLLSMDDDPKRPDLPPMFSWLSSRIAGYPDTLNLKMFAHLQEPGTRPYFRLENSSHPLAQEYHHGIAPEQVKEIMLRNLPVVEA